MDEAFGHILTAATALAGLILVFLGQAASAFDGFDASEQATVRPRYRKRARLAFDGLLGALVAIAASLVSLCWNPPWLLAVAVLGVVAAFVLLTVLSWITLKDLE